VTKLLRDWSDGDRQAQEQLFHAVYNELRRQAARYLRHENPGFTLRTSGLIHEAFFQLIDQRDDLQQSRVVELRFFSGLSVEETAAALEASERTVKRDWNVAKAWLRRELTRGGRAGARANANDT